MSPRRPDTDDTMRAASAEAADAAPAPTRRPAIDPAAHRRAQNLERRVDLVEGELHGLVGADGIKTRLSKVQDALERIESKLDRLGAQLQASGPPDWIWPPFGAALVTVIGTLLYLAMRKSGVW